MSRYIDADRLMVIFENRCDEADSVEAWLAYAIACEDVRDLPVADVVEVVRCKDCKHADLFYPYCTIWEAAIDGDGYCYKGEKEDGVRHGRWIPTLIMGDRGSAGYSCSVCHKFNKTDSDSCPNCGSRMDLGEETK